MSRQAAVINRSPEESGVPGRWLWPLLYAPRGEHPFATLDVASGQAKTGHYVRRRQELLDFMNKVVADYPDSEPHVMLDNLNIHKPKTDGWLRRHPRVHFHYAPTYACWLNQVECWFGILSRQALKGAGFISARELRKTIDRFATVYNPAASHFDWKKTMAHLATLKRYCSNLRNWVPGRHADSHYSARCL